MTVPVKICGTLSFGTENVEESFLWEFDAADLLHSAFPFFLVVEVFQFSFVVSWVEFRSVLGHPTGNFGITSVQTGSDICAHCGQRLPGDDTFPNSGLNWNLK